MTDSRDTPSDIRVEAEMHLSYFTIVTSNPRKLREFRRYGLPCACEPGPDIREVESDPQTVVVHKALSAGAMRIVEDSSLQVDGLDVGVNVRFHMERGETTLLAGRRAQWTVLVAKNDGRSIALYRGITKGRLVERPMPKDSFGFEPIFIPSGARETLHELGSRDAKDSYSARLKACRELLRDRPVATIDIRDVEPWTGAYQGDASV